MAPAGGHRAWPLFIRFSPWGLAMRATAENADSARLSGVWVRRTSTITWVIAGLLSAVTAILNAPGPDQRLTDVLSPDLLLLALTAALVGAMVNLPVAFVAGIAIGVIDEVLDYNFASTATVELILFVHPAGRPARAGRHPAQGRPRPRSARRGSWAPSPAAGIADLRRRLVRQGGIGHRWWSRRSCCRSCSTSATST